MVTDPHGPARDEGAGMNDLESNAPVGRHDMAADTAIPEQQARPHPADPGQPAEQPRRGATAGVAGAEPGRGQPGEPGQTREHAPVEPGAAGPVAAGPVTAGHAADGAGTEGHAADGPVAEGHAAAERANGHGPAARPPAQAQERAGARELFVRLRDLPDDAPERARLRDTLVRMHLPLVEHLARRFRNRGEPLDDLTQVATIGLIKSVDRFDPDRGVEFSTYATPTVVGEIKRHFRDKGWAVRVPRRLQELRLSLSTATAELSQQHGRAPTVHELAQRLSISEEDVLEGLESANAYSTLSLDVPDTDDESPAVADTLGAEDDALEGVEYRESLKPLLEQLPPREKKILLLRFFGNMTQSQIAQEVGISQMHVSRLLARTLAQLRDKLLVED
ncbi:SigB/SigF/SigG family RNA polymerase sigma factor [Streptomyces sp. JJ66]|nr:SigB/SigF/SigG family RNA polymerase sigma factor [Streptomyces sp. JJ66]